MYSIWNLIIGKKEAEKLKGRSDLPAKKNDPSLSNSGPFPINRSTKDRRSGFVCAGHMQRQPSDTNVGWPDEAKHQKSDTDLQGRNYELVLNSVNKMTLFVKNKL